MMNYGVDFTGDLFVNPQGFDVPVAFGYEHRSRRMVLTSLMHLLQKVYLLVMLINL